MGEGNILAETGIPRSVRGRETLGHTLFPDRAITRGEVSGFGVSFSASAVGVRKGTATIGSGLVPITISRYFRR